MEALLYFFITVAAFCLMEGMAWLTHKYLMHGWLWILHEDHHKKRDGFFEKNDAFFLIFATPSVLLFWFGVQGYTWMLFAGLGILLYGIAYFLVHDVIIHQRFKWFSRSDNSYIRAIRWAHKMHHKHLEREDGESFGMLFVARKYWRKVKNEKPSTKKQIEAL